jgi:hypothetical protein
VAVTPTSAAARAKPTPRVWRTTYPGSTDVRARRQKPTRSEIVASFGSVATPLLSQEPLGPMTEFIACASGP